MIFFSKVFLSFYHNKIHWVTNYKDTKNEINKTRQQRTKKQTNKQTNKQANKSKTKKNKQTTKKKTRWNYTLPPPPFSFWTEYQSIIWSIGCRFLNNLSLLGLDNSFSISLILLIVIFKWSKFNCLVFLAL